MLGTCWVECEYQIRTSLTFRFAPGAVGPLDSGNSNPKSKISGDSPSDLKFMILDLR
jgi:hypothetical protein